MLLRKVCRVLAAAGLTMASGPAKAQQTPPEQPEMFCGPEWNIYGCPPTEGVQQWHRQMPVTEFHPFQWGTGPANSIGGISGDNTPGGISGDNTLGGISGDNSPGGISGDNTPGGIEGP
jgi:hypothetical protein